jgi:hypothetical protein
MDSGLFGEWGPDEFTSAGRGDTRPLGKHSLEQRFE